MNWYDSQAGTLEFDGIVSVYDEEGNMIDSYKKGEKYEERESVDEQWLKVPVKFKKKSISARLSSQEYR